MSERIRVVLIDDQQLIRAGLAMLLSVEDDIEVVGEAGDGKTGLELIRRVAPEVALMDVRMPVMDGIAATERVVLDAQLSTKVLVLTTFDTDEAVVAAIRVGASGFLLKDAEPDEIVRGVRAVAAGDAVLAPSALRRLLSALGPGLTGLATASGPLSGGEPAVPQAQAAPVSAADRRMQAAVASLTDREREVLGLVGAGLTNAEIAQRLFVAETTAKTHVHRVMGKLAARDRVQAALIAQRAGVVVPD